MHENRTLIRGDNLMEMQEFPNECIDLIATDPPFNSKRDYFVPFRDEHGQKPDTLVRAFTDIWRWKLLPYSSMRFRTISVTFCRDCPSAKERCYKFVCRCKTFNLAKLLMWITRRQSFY